MTHDSSGTPHRIWLCHQTEESDYNPGRGRYVGEASDGSLFWVTTPFVWSRTEKPGRDFVAVYRWTPSGEFVSATIEEMAPRHDPTLPGNTSHAGLYEAAIGRAMASLGNVLLRDIEVAPFKTLHDGISFGLVPCGAEAGRDASVNAMPGDYMCFWPPWDGEYDT